MTPFLNPATPSHEAYNRYQITTRNTIERCFGVLKRRFPCLHSGMQIKLPKVLKVVVACVILHNMAFHLDDHVMKLDELAAEDMHEVEIHVQNQRAENCATRTAIVDNYFNN